MIAGTATGVRHRILVGAWVGFGAGLVLHLMALRSNTWPARAMSEAIYLIALGLALTGAAVVATRVSGSDRKFWLSMAAVLGLILPSEVYFSYYVLFVDAAGPPLPGNFELLHLLALGVFFSMVISIARFGQGARVRRARFFTGAAAGLVALYVLSLEFVAMPTLARVPGVDGAEIAVTAVYPVLGVALLASCYGVLFGVHYRRWRTWEWLVVGVFTAFAAALLAMPFWYRALVQEASNSAAGGLAPLALTAGPYLLFMAALYRTQEPDRSDALPPGPQLDETPPWLRIAYPIVLVSMVPVLGSHVLAHAGEPYARILMASTLTLAGLLLARSWLAAVEAAEHARTSAQDPLTGLENERSLRTQLSFDAAEAKRYGGRIALAILDVDDLTRINELYGHGTGDEVMRRISRVLESACRGRGRAYRVGSDEFALVIPGVSAEDAGETARRVVRSVERDVGAHGTSVTLSAGVTSLDESSSAEDLISDAFSALQTVKLLRRGSVRIYGDGQPVMPGPDERLELARKEAYLATMRALAAAVDARDPIAREHSRNVARLSRLLGEELGLDPIRVSALETAGFVHDIGKLAMPDELLVKRGDFTPDEGARMREHVEIGEHILRSTELAFMLPWVRAHHERWDGSGYPDGLSGGAIPLEARIISVCDSYDSMTSGVWRSVPLSREAALATIDLAVGKQFDGYVADAFIRMMSSAPDEAQADIRL